MATATATATEDHEETTPRADRPRRRIAALLERAAAGDVEAWSTIVDEYDGLVRAVASHHALSEADTTDVVRATWLRLIQYVDRLDEPSQLGAWLARTARQACLEKLRRVDSGLLEAERDAALWSAFGRLPARDKAFLRVLVKDPRPSRQEISPVLDVPAGSIGPSRGRALERLRRELARSEALIDSVDLLMKRRSREPTMRGRVLSLPLGSERPELPLHRPHVHAL